MNRKMPQGRPDIEKKNPTKYGKKSRNQLTYHLQVEVGLQLDSATRREFHLYRQEVFFVLDHRLRSKKMCPEKQIFKLYDTCYRK